MNLDEITKGRETEEGTESEPWGPQRVGRKGNPAMAMSRGSGRPEKTHTKEANQGEGRPVSGTPDRSGTMSSKMRPVDLATG